MFGWGTMSGFDAVDGSHQTATWCQNAGAVLRDHPTLDFSEQPPLAKFGCQHLRQISSAPLLADLFRSDVHFVRWKGRYTGPSKMAAVDPKMSLAGIALLALFICKGCKWRLRKSIPPKRQRSQN